MNRQLSNVQQITKIQILFSIYIGHFFFPDKALLIDELQTETL